MSNKPWWHIEKQQLRTLFFWSVIIAIAPFAIELVFIANIAGAEVTVIFFMAWIKHLVDTYKYRVHTFKASAKNILQIVSQHSVAAPRTFLAHSSMSMCLLFVTGTLTYAIVVWYPIILFGGNLGGYA